MKTFFALPLVTEKSMAQSGEGVYQFVVPTWVTKQQISAFVTKQFSVTVIDVHTMRVQPTVKRFRNKLGLQNGYKKAIVTLKKGDTIADFSLPVEATQQPSTLEKESAPAVEPKTESKITVRSKSKKAA